MLRKTTIRKASASDLRMGWSRITLPTDAAECAESGRLLARPLNTEANVEDPLDSCIAVPTQADGS